MTTTNDIPERACARCGASLEGRRPNVKFCDARCKDRDRRERNREAGKVTYVRQGRPATVPSRWKYTPGDTFGALTLVERTGNDRADFRCDCGNIRTLSINNVRSGVTQNCADRRHHPDPRNVGDAAAYSTMHHRLAKLYGPASAHPCFVCGAQADGCAFLHGTPDVKADSAGKDAGRPFSTDPAQYAPACKSHHGRWDTAKGRTAGTGLSLAHRALWLALHDAAEEVAA